MAQLSFIGRQQELATLRKFTVKASGSHLTAIYGRRRVGKTRLVQEACTHLPIYSFEGLEGRGSAAQKRHFLKSLYRYSKLEAHRLAATGDWIDLLVLLVEYIGDKPCVVFFDEFQWMAAQRNALVSKLKYVWDNYFLKRCRVHLIICGSVSSFIVKKVLQSRALYGRIDSIINLLPLTFSETKTGFFENRSPVETLEYYLAMGGVPKYLELYKKNKSVRLNIADLCFKKNGYMSEEYHRIFVSHFGKVAYYQRIVEYLAQRGFATRDQLLRHCQLKSGGRVSTFLEDLDLAGFIEGYSPVHNATSTHLRRFRIADPYLRFYFQFIHPQLTRIRTDSDGVPLAHALPESKYRPYLGLAFEQFCHWHAHTIARCLGFSAVNYQHGSWFRKNDLGSGAQIDLIYKRSDNVITLCEVKFRKRIGKEIIHEVEQKCDALSQWTNATIERVLISAYPPTNDLYNEGYFATVLTPDDFI